MIYQLLMVFMNTDFVPNVFQDQMKDTQNQILSQQDKILKSLIALDKKVSAAPSKDDKKKDNNKRKTPNPNFVHNIDIGNSVVLGNPDAKVTVTKFTDFQ